MSRLREPVHYGQNNRIALGGREGGRAVTKSSAMWDQGLEGTDSGWSSPSGGRLEVLPRAQTEQAKTKSRTSRAMEGHQNCCLTRKLVRPILGWQATLHLHLVIWQTLLSKATYNWGIHKAIHLEEAIRQRKCS